MREEGFKYLLDCQSSSVRWVSANGVAAKAFPLKPTRGRRKVCACVVSTIAIMFEPGAIFKSTVAVSTQVVFFI